MSGSASATRTQTRTRSLEARTVEVEAAWRRAPAVFAQRWEKRIGTEPWALPPSDLVEDALRDVLDEDAPHGGAPRDQRVDMARRLRAAIVRRHAIGAAMAERLRTLPIGELVRFEALRWATAGISSGTDPVTLEATALMTAGYGEIPFPDRLLLAAELAPERFTAQGRGRWLALGSEHRADLLAEPVRWGDDAEWQTLELRPIALLHVT